MIQTSSPRNPATVLQDVLNILQNHRQVGQTSTLVGAAKINPKAVIVVGNYHTEQILFKEHHLPPNQVFTLEDFLTRLWGADLGPFLFDTTAIIEMLYIAKRRMEQMEDYQQRLEDKLDAFGVSHI